MKTILAWGIFGTLFMYMFFSFGNKTWDPMEYNTNSTYWFGCLSGICWLVGILWSALTGSSTKHESYYKDLFK